MRHLVTGLLTFSVATSGVPDIARINNNCEDELPQVLLKNMLTASLEKPQHDVKVTCRPMQNLSSKKKAMCHWRACTCKYL